MNLDEAAALLPLHRPDRPAESRIQKAIRMAEADPSLASEFAAQKDFDTRMLGVVRSIAPPENLHAKLREAGSRCESGKPKLRSHAFNPAVLTAVLGVVLILGFVTWTVMERMEKFGGRESIERMLSATSKMTGVELDAVAGSTGTMQDWFYMRGFEGYTVPADVAALPVVGSRVFRIDGHAIAQLAVDRHESILYVFRVSDFAVELPDEKAWKLMEFEGWAAALQRRGDICSMLAFRGTKSEMHEFLAALKKP